MGKRLNKNQTSDQDVAAFTKDASESAVSVPLTQEQRDHHSHPRPLVKIVNYAADTVVQTSLEQLNQQTNRNGSSPFKS